MNRRDNPAVDVTPELLDRSRAAMADRRRLFEWDDIAHRTLDVLEEAADRVAAQHLSSVSMPS